VQSYKGYLKTTKPEFIFKNEVRFSPRPFLFISLSLFLKQPGEPSQVPGMVCAEGMAMPGGAPVGLTAHRPSSRLAPVFLFRIISL
jgi:hypothetical protein